MSISGTFGSSVLGNLLLHYKHRVLCGKKAMAEPSTPPGGATPEPEAYVSSPVPTLDMGTPVTYSPPGMEPFQDPPVLPNAFPIGGVQNLFKAVSHIYIYIYICV